MTRSNWKFPSLTRTYVRSSFKNFDSLAPKRTTLILNSMVGAKVNVHNGKNKVPVYITKKNGES